MQTFSIANWIRQLPFQEKEALDQLIVERHLEKGASLLPTQAYDDKAYYVVEGILRKFCLQADQEVTQDFFFRDEVCFPESTSYQTLATYQLVALTSTTVFELNLITFNHLKRQAPHLVQLEYQILEWAYLQTQQRLHAFQTLNATERYLQLLDKSPRIIQHIPLMYIASYLGINNASLSKIRRAILKI